MPKKDWEPKIDLRNKKMLMRHFQGAKPDELSEIFGIKKNQVSRIINSPPGRAYLDELVAKREAVVVQDPAAMVDKAAPEAVQKVVQTMRGETDPTPSEKWATKLLVDKAVPDKRVNVNVNVNVQFTPDEVAQHKREMRESGVLGMIAKRQDVDDYIDVEVNEVPTGIVPEDEHDGTTGIRQDSEQGAIRAGGET